MATIALFVRIRAERLDHLLMSPKPFTMANVALFSIIGGSCHKRLSRQTYFCRDKRRVCRDKMFVATKMILVAAPANDNSLRPSSAL